jgi:tRNA (mo5U34)-methyltransferase
VTELQSRGADVVAIDHDPHYLRQARWAGERLGLADRIELRQMGVYDLARLSETFDLVLFMGVLYHLRHPLLAIDVVAERTAGTLVLQTLTVPGPHPPDQAPADVAFGDRAVLREPWWPHMAFVEHQLAADPTNWWVPTPSAVVAMVRSTGFDLVAEPDHEVWIFERHRPFVHGEELEAATGRGGG